MGGFFAALLALSLGVTPAALPAAAVERASAPAADVATCTDQVGPSIAPPPASAVAPGLRGYHAAFYGQSGYPTLCPGSSSKATIAFANTGTLGWYRSSAPAYLGTWGPEPGQDRPSPLGGVATGWPRMNRVAVQPAEYVGPGQVAWFQFTIKAPMQPGTYRLALRPLVEGHEWLEDFGVFWFVTVKDNDASVPAAAPVAPIAKEPLQAVPARTYFPSLVGGVRQIRVNSLMYHYVDWLPETPDRFGVDLTVSPTDFGSHLTYLRAQGYNGVTTTDIWWSLDTGGPLPPKPVNITFDDGTIGQYQNAFKLLKQHGFVATFYVSLNLIGREGYLTRAMVRELSDAGMDVQSHAVDHTPMPRADQPYQMCASRRILSEWTGKDVRHFAYPGGDYDPASFAALAQCGYLSAYWKAGGSLQSRDRMFLLYRERVRGQQGLASLLSALTR